MGANVLLVNPATYIAIQLKTFMDGSVQFSKKGSIYFHVTGDGEQFFIIMKKLIK